EGVILFAKYLLLFGIIYRIVHDRQSFWRFGLAHVGGCLILGWMAYGTHVSGRLESVLTPGIDDSKLLGVHLITGLAFASFLFVGFSDWKRWAALAAIPFILNGIILTASRSAFIGLLAAGAAALLLTPRGYRRVAYVAGALAVVLFLLLARNEVFWSRL